MLLEAELDPALAPELESELEAETLLEPELLEPELLEPELLGAVEVELEFVLKLGLEFWFASEAELDELLDDEPEDEFDEELEGGPELELEPVDSLETVLLLLLLLAEFI